MNRIRALLAASGLLLSAAAHAHAFLERAEPRTGSTVSSAPAELRLWFSEPLEGAFSSVEVTDGQGRPVHAARAQVDPRERGLLHVPLTPLPPGSYTANWRAVSVDTHVSEGHFVFHVAP